MPRTAAQIAEKFEREWLQSKPTAIDNYNTVANTLAQKAIDAKATMISRFTEVMATDKFEDRLQPYVGNAKMSDAYTQSLGAKTAMTDAEKLKVANDVQLKRSLGSQLEAVIVIYKAQSTAGEVTVPAGVTDQGLRAMLVQGVNANQYGLSNTATAQQIYEATKTYMKDNLGWPVVA